MNDQKNTHFEKVMKHKNLYAIVSLTSFALSLAIIITLGFQTLSRGRSPRRLAASEFVVVDDNGSPLIRLGKFDNPWGKAGLEFLDANGAGRIVVSIGNSGDPYIMLRDPDSGNQVILDLQPKQGPALSFRNNRNPGGILVAANSNGFSGIAFMDTNGNRVLEMGLEMSGFSKIILRTKDGETAFQVPQAQ